MSGGSLAALGQAAEREAKGRMGLMEGVPDCWVKGVVSIVNGSASVV